MFLIVGLGNPGIEYVNTRHNVGFMAVDAIASEYGFGAFKTKFSGLISEGSIKGEKVFILKPQTFMNLSGNSVVKAALFYKILPENIIVIHDDLDLVLGQIKSKKGGGAGGHNGLKSLDQHISKEYNRIRIGIGYPRSDNADKVIGHVLGKVSQIESDEIEKSIDKIVKKIDVLMKYGVAKFSSDIGTLQTKKI